MEREVSIRVSRLDKEFAGREVLHGVDLEIAQGEFLVLLGASGCGKSTLLHLMAGLEPPSRGWLELPARGCAFMFQEASLYPWLTAAGNVELALRVRGLPRARRREEAARLLELVRLGGHAGYRPHQLSGGMRQRVSLARSLAQDRPVLLMDEPFSALDEITREHLHEQLRQIWRETGRTIVFVTHSVAEAVALGQRIVLLRPRPGRIGREWTVPEHRRSGPGRSVLEREIGEAMQEVTDEDDGVGRWVI